MKYVNKKMVCVIHRMVLELSGGADSIIEESDCGIKPGHGLGFIDMIFTNSVFGQKIYPDVYHQAAAYMFYIIKDHIFMDGNKRTGLACAITFLEWNGIVLAPFEEDEVFEFVVAIAGGKNEPSDLIPKIAEWFKEMSLH